MKSGSFIIRYRWWIIGLSLAISIAFGLQIFRAEINPDMESYIFEGMPSRINTNIIEEIFGGDEMIMVIFESEDVLSKETLSRVKNVNKELKKLDGVDETLSLFDAKNIKGEDGSMLVDPAVRRIPKTESDREELRTELAGNQLVKNILVSEDFKMTTIITTLKPEAQDKEIIQAIDEVLERVPGEETIYIGGQPYIKALVAVEMAREFKLLMIIGLGVMLIMLLIFFREIRGVVLPFSVVIMSILFSMGFMPMIGWQMSIITLLLPIMLIAIANDYGIHMMAKYQEYNLPGNNTSIGMMARGIFTSLKSPVMLTGVTTIAGILCLLSHKMIPARQLGVVAAAGIGFALILSLLFIPAALAVTGKSKPVLSTNTEKQHFLDRMLVRTGRLVSIRPRRILVIALVVSLISGVGAFLVKVDTNLENFFPEKHPVRVSSSVINSKFGGSQNISILVEGDIMDPDVMKKIDFYETELKKHHNVGNVMSIAGVIHEISKALNDEGDDFYDVIPGSRNAIAQYMELYLMSGDPDDLERMVDFDFQKAQIIVRINNGSNAALNDVLSEIQRLTDGDEHISRIGGYGLVAADLAGLVVQGQVLSLVIAILIVFLLLSAIFRSFAAGLIGSIPLVLAMTILFGWMGYIGIRLDIATALLSSIMIGVGVDYTIHFLWRYRTEREKGLDPSGAVMKTLTTTGRGISFNALSVILGFCALPFSVFPPLRFFGFLVIVTIFCCLVGALIIIPALVLIFKPAFLEPGKKAKDRIHWQVMWNWLKKGKPVTSDA
jgi:uncharacterized protein